MESRCLRWKDEKTDSRRSHLDISEKLDPGPDFIYPAIFKEWLLKKHLFFQREGKYFVGALYINSSDHKPAVPAVQCGKPG